MFLIILALLSSAFGYDRTRHPADPRVEQYVDGNEASPFICYLSPPQWWREMQRSWIVENDSSSPVTMTYGDGTEIVVQDRAYRVQAAVPKVAGGASREVSVLLPKQTCYGVFPVNEFMEARQSGRRMIIRAQRLSGATTAPFVEENGVLILRSSLYFDLTHEIKFKVTGTGTCMSRSYCWNTRVEDDEFTKR